MTVKSTVSTITRFINVSAEIFLSICLNNSGLFALIQRFVGCTDVARRSQRGFFKHACGIITTCSGVADAELNRRSGLGQKSAFSPYHSAVRSVVFVKLIHGTACIFFCPTGSHQRPGMVGAAWY